MVSEDWGDISAYVGEGEDLLGEERRPPRITSGELFAFTGELIDVKGNAIEPEHPPAEFMDWIEGLMPQNENVSYSGEKVPYLLAVYEAVPEWLGISEEDMKETYGYNPHELKTAFREQRGPTSKIIQNILSDLSQKAEDILHEYDTQNHAPPPDETLG